MIDNKTMQPPKIAEWILGKLIDNETKYTAVGDYAEQYVLNVQNNGVLSARIRYWVQVLSIAPVYLLDRLFWSLIIVNLM